MLLMQTIKKYNILSKRSQREILWLFKSYIAFKIFNIYNILIDVNSLPKTREKHGRIIVMFESMAADRDYFEILE